MQNEKNFRWALLFLLVGFVAHRAYFSRKLQRPEEDTLVEKEGPADSALASLFGLPALASTALYLIVPRSMSWASLPLPPGLRWSGLLLAGAGFGLLQWAHQALARNWSDKPRLLVDQELVTAGPYRWIRHPIYSAFLMILSAPLLLSANWFIGLAWLGMTAADVLSRVRFEEAAMEAQFGEKYLAYKESTGALAPRWNAKLLQDLYPQK